VPASFEQVVATADRVFSSLLTADRIEQNSTGIEYPREKQPNVQVESLWRGRQDGCGRWTHNSQRARRPPSHHSANQAYALAQSDGAAETSHQGGAEVEHMAPEAGSATGPCR
jgi:hypothetical protein